MRNNNRLDEFLKSIIASDDDAVCGLPVDETALEEIIEKELQKSDSEMNTDLIDFCINMIFQARETVFSQNKTDVLSGSNTSPARTKIILPTDTRSSSATAPTPVAEALPEKKATTSPEELKEIKKQKRRRRLGKTFLIAAIITIIFSFTLSVSAKVFDFQIDEKIFALFEKDAKVDFGHAKTTPETYNTPDTDLTRELAENGITPVLLPSALLDGDWTIGDITYDKQELNTTASIKISNNNHKKIGSIIVTRYNKEGLFDGSIDYVKSKTGIQKNVNGIDIIILEHEKYTIITYLDANTNTRYSIKLPCNQDEAVVIAETIQ